MPPTAFSRAEARLGLVTPPLVLVLPALWVVCCGAMFEKSLQDVVKGIRANKRDPSDYISATIAEIKVELRSSDAFIKAQAVRNDRITTWVHT